MTNQDLAIKRLVLYKHGVAFLERRGKFKGERLDLAFGRSELDDVLKSIAVADHAGGSITAVNYETPASGKRKVDMQHGSGMLDLLQALVGFSVRLDVAGEDSPSEGRFAGLQFKNGKKRNLSHATMLLIPVDGAFVRQIAVPKIKQIELLEKHFRDDLVRELDIKKQVDGNQAVTIHMTPGEHDLEISYLVPAAAWRVSYRVAAEIDGFSEKGVLVLQGWGLIDNQFGEDLVDIDITLVAGRPMSFLYDLTTSTIPERKRIGGASDDKHEGRKAGETAMCRSRTSISECGVAYSVRSDELDSLGDLFASKPPEVEVLELGELLAYRVLEPVRVPKGKSSLVPFMMARLEYVRELLFNAETHRKHPMACVRAVNDSGLVLEEGPITIVENGSYVGEAVVPYTIRGEELLLPFAMELGVDVNVETEHSQIGHKIHLADAALIQRLISVVKITYSIENRNDRDVIVTIECARQKLPGDLRADHEATVHESFYRWKIECKSGESAVFQVEAHELRELRTVSEFFTPDILKTLLVEAERADEGPLSDLHRLYDDFEALGRELSRLESEQRDSKAKRDALRKDLEVINSSPKESATRLRLIQKMESLISRGESMENEAGMLEDRRDELIRQMRETVAGGRK